MRRTVPGHRLLTIAASLPLVAAAPSCAYLLVLTAVAPLARRRSPPPADACRFAVLIPAHNEEQVLCRLLESLAALEYPRSLYDVHVVADNCTDATAVVARRGGAVVHERHDTVQVGKGYALQWLLDRLANAGRAYDAYVIVDADSTLSRNFLSAMAAEIAAGAEVMQAYYSVLPMHGTPAESLRELALALVHYLRPLAKNALGASAGLKGNGMCFRRSVIERFGWPTAGLAEDVEYHLTLVDAGTVVKFVPDAVVRAEMPASLGGATSQNLRWERGRLSTIRHQAFPLLWRGLRRGDVAAIDAAVEQFVPPLSVVGALVVDGFALASIGRLRFAQRVAATLGLILAVHVVTGTVLARVPVRRYRALAYLPRYTIWKAALYTRALVQRHDQRWVRTERTQVQEFGSAAERATRT